MWMIVLLCSWLMDRMLTSERSHKGQISCCVTGNHMCKSALLLLPVVVALAITYFLSPPRSKRMCVRARSDYFLSRLSPLLLLPSKRRKTRAREKHIWPSVLSRSKYDDDDAFVYLPQSPVDLCRAVIILLCCCCLLLLMSALCV